MADKGDQVSVTFKCENCGGTVLTLPDDHTDASIASCKQCGVAFGRWGDIKAKAMDLAATEALASLKGAFKGLKGWKVE